MPVDRFFPSQVPAHPGPDATGPVGVTSIKIASRRQVSPVEATDGGREGAGEGNDEGVGAGLGGQVVGIPPTEGHSYSL